jgi:hypothetical protein
MDNLPAEAWVLKFDGNAALSAAAALYAVCSIKVHGDVKVDTGVVVG